MRQGSRASVVVRLNATTPALLVFSPTLASSSGRLARRMAYDQTVEAAEARLRRAKEKAPPEPGESRDSHHGRRPWLGAKASRVSELKPNFRLTCAQPDGYPQKSCIDLWITMWVFSQALAEKATSRIACRKPINAIQPGASVKVALRRQKGVGLAV